VYIDLPMYFASLVAEEVNQEGTMLQTTQTAEIASFMDCIFIAQ
jgi:hypothetical protein